MDIAAIIEKEIEVFEELDKLLDKEKMILINNLAKDLPSVTEDKKNQLSKIFTLEKARKEIYKDKTGEEFVAEGLIKMEHIEKMRTITNSISQKNSLNGALTKQSLTYIKMLGSALNPLPRNTTYENTGRISNNTDKSIFTRQI